MPQITYDELNAVWTLKNQVEREQRRLVDLVIVSQSITTVWDGMPHAKPLTFKVERLSLLIAECKKTIDDLSAQVIDCKLNLLTKLQSLKLKEMHERVLSYHYVSCLRLNDVAKTIGFTRRYVNKLHAQALNALGLTFADMAKSKISTQFKDSSN